MADSSTPRRALSSVCVYCGSSNTTKPEYLDLAARFGAALAARKLRLVYGGGAVGLMGRCAKAAHEAGGDVLGIMPRFLERREITYEAVPHRMVDTMHERKHVMFEESDAFVVLPGGIGTLEEAVETLSWARLGLHAKPMVFLSEDEFWAPFFALMEHTVAANLTPASFREAVTNVHSIEDCFAALEARAQAA
ncbi:MAG TPA: TIGR00730 family Rossman fold protein [Candidatus Binatia bacterium]|nr:TIGR00730 family Rossman fold protein [Candidatus Binatia bacterium]